MIPTNNSGISQIKDNYLDINSLNSVKAMGRNKDPQALKEIAKQFEAMFVQQMIKNMREADKAFSEGSYFDSSEMQFHQQMLDQQLSLEMTKGRGMGIADALYAQMSQAYGTEAKASVEGIAPLNAQDAAKTNGQLANIFHQQQLSAAFANGDATDDGSVGQQSQPQAFAAALIAQARAERAMALQAGQQKATEVGGGKASIADSPAEFIAALKPYAEKAAAELNVNTDVLLAQAALETGWGKHVIHSEKGGNSFNLFNIKADSGWQGDKINVSTLEYDRGVATKERADFRNYRDYAESFSDYVSFLQDNPRYQRALQSGDDSQAYADALQQAGYATDPAYAEKIKSLLDSDPIRAAAQTLVALASDTDTTQ